jgi:TatD DNase family protein
MIKGESQNGQDDLMQVIKRATHAGCEKMMITAGNQQEAEEAQSFLDQLLKDDPETHSRIYTTVGVHPTRAQEFLKNPEEYLLNINRLARHPRVVAIGECGLDYDRLEFCPKDIQKE